ncbi:hypothetical protein [Thioalkalivibrio sp. ALE16]|uniref:hypothetical protein n=1 Tax=Thioalkalivibrio sp. ALE16 TaxID=1158172 RepID=UPI0003631BF6|nr:hypothetical protein [Thioalkalivibrio sp. ALE16]
MNKTATINLEKNLEDALTVFVEQVLSGQLIQEVCGPLAQALPPTPPENASEDEDGVTLAAWRLVQAVESNGDVCIPWRDLLDEMIKWYRLSDLLNRNAEKHQQYRNRAQDVLKELPQATGFATESALVVDCTTATGESLVYVPFTVFAAPNQVDQAANGDVSLKAATRAKLVEKGIEVEEVSSIMGPATAGQYEFEAWLKLDG